MSVTLRTFLALTLEAEAKECLTHLGQRVARTLEAGRVSKLRATRSEQLHLTLAFLGDTPKDLVERISALVVEVASRNRAPSLRSDRILFLPKPRQARVVALGFIDERGIAARLVADLTTSLRPLGFAFESRAFLPHITLLRSRESLHVSALPQKLEQSPSEIVLKLRELSYFASFLGPHGARHEILSTTSLPPSIP